MTEIAARAQAPIGSLYQFFPTKAALAMALHEDLLSVLDEMLGELRERASAGSDRVARTIRRLGEFMDLYPEFAVLLSRRDLSKDARRATRAVMQRHVAALLAPSTLSLRRKRTEVLAAILLEMMRLMPALIAGDDSELRSAVLAEYRRMFRAYLESCIAT